MERFEYLATVKYHLNELTKTEQDRIIDSLLDRFKEANNDVELIKMLGPAENLAHRYIDNQADIVIDDDIHHIDIEAVFVPVYIYEAKDDRVHINYTKNIDESSISYKVNDEKLALKLQLDGAYKDAKIEVFLPNKRLESVNLTQTYSLMEIGKLNASSIRLKNDVGQMIVGSVEADDFTCYLQTGEMRVKMLRSKMLKFNVSTGKLVLSDVNEDQHIDGKVATGNVMMTLNDAFKNATLNLKEQFGRLDIEGYSEVPETDTIGDGKYNVKLVASYGTLMVDTN